MHRCGTAMTLRMGNKLPTNHWVRRRRGSAENVDTPSMETDSTNGPSCTEVLDKRKCRFARRGETVLQDQCTQTVPGKQQKRCQTREQKRRQTNEDNLGTRSTSARDAHQRTCVLWKTAPRASAADARTMLHECSFRICGRPSGNCDRSWRCFLQRQFKQRQASHCLEKQRGVLQYSIEN